MSEPARKVPAVMDTAEFLAWDAPRGSRWQLVDGEPQAMAPASRTHGIIQAELVRLIGNHLDDRGSPCMVVDERRHRPAHTIGQQRPHPRPGSHLQ